LKKWKPKNENNKRKKLDEKKTKEKVEDGKIF
jgi:hypothetical protein